MEKNLGKPTSGIHQPTPAQPDQATPEQGRPAEGRPAQGQPVQVRVETSRESTARPMTKVRQNERWNNLQSHLDEALNQWNEISVQMKDELSPDEKRLQEVKQLLNQLKVKLEEF